MTTVRQQLRETLRESLEAMKIFRSVHKDKWQPMSEDEVPACRIELTSETVEKISNEKTFRTAEIQVICYVADPEGNGEAGELYADAVEGGLILPTPFATQLESFGLTSIDFDSSSEADTELVAVTLTYNASWCWRPDELPDLGPLEIIHADIDCATGDPPGPDGKIEASATIKLKE